jgi:hypothetical protein
MEQLHRHSCCPGHERRAHHQFNVAVLRLGGIDQMRLSKRPCAARARIGPRRGRQRWLRCSHSRHFASGVRLSSLREAGLCAARMVPRRGAPTLGQCFHSRLFAPEAASPRFGRRALRSAMVPRRGAQRLRSVSTLAATSGADERRLFASEDRLLPSGGWASQQNFKPLSRQGEGFGEWEALNERPCATGRLLDKPQARRALSPVAPVPNRPDALRCAVGGTGCPTRARGRGPW